MTFPAPPLVALAYYAVHIASVGLIIWFYTRRRKLPAPDDSQRKRFAGLRNRYSIAIAAVLIMWVVAQVLLAKFAPGLPRLNP